MKKNNRLENAHKAFIETVEKDFGSSILKEKTKIKIINTINSKSTKLDLITTNEGHEIISNESGMSIEKEELGFW